MRAQQLKKMKIDYEQRSPSVNERAIAREKFDFWFFCFAIALFTMIAFQYLLG